MMASLLGSLDITFVLPTLMLSPIMLAMSFNNYRPVSVLSAISKLFEKKVMFDQLYALFTPTFSPNMPGFLKGHSCATVLIKLTDDWRSALDEKKEVGVVAIDLTKASDCICHTICCLQS